MKPSLSYTIINTQPTSIVYTPSFHLIYSEANLR